MNLTVNFGDKSDGGKNREKSWNDVNVNNILYQRLELLKFLVSYVLYP